ncbi:MAG TPA: hypothetical protein VGX70_18370, partial [Gemmataceae bacterium]|nr:hypothetical protein [Gemmataceae bacterium]
YRKRAGWKALPRIRFREPQIARQAVTVAPCGTIGRVTPDYFSAGIALQDLFASAGMMDWGWSLRDF